MGVLALTRKERKALAQLRCGVTPLRIETGRWEKTENHALPADQRLCLYCTKWNVNDIESEEHFLLKCLHPELSRFRNELISKASSLAPNFLTLDDKSKVAFLLSHPDMVFYSAKICSKMLNIRSDVSRNEFLI